MCLFCGMALRIDWDNPSIARCPECDATIRIEEPDV